MNASTDPVFVIADATGPDPVHDGVFFFEAWAFPVDEGPVALIQPTWLQPFSDLAPGSPLSRKLSDLGLRGEKLANLPHCDQELPAILAPFEARPVVLPQGQAAFRELFRRHCPDCTPPICLDLEAFAALLLPHRGARDYRTLYQRHHGRKAPEPWRAEHTRALTESLVRLHHDRSEAVRQLFARSFDEIQTSCADEESFAHEWLELARRLLDRPSRYGAGHQDLFRSPPEDGVFSEDLEFAALDPDRLLREVDPEFQSQYRLDYEPYDSLAERLDEAAGLEPEDQRILENFFDLLPKHFAREAGDDPAERPSQRALAHAVEGVLRDGAFCIADAPTGTGKTLAYLAPLLLWSTRHHVRTGVSTFTRALQEQAFLREVPRALQLLREAGLPADWQPRVSMMKGRSNYICGRAILDAAPGLDGSSPVARATWLRLALFYLEDPSADLDGFTLSPGIPFSHPTRTARVAGAMIHQVRALPSCCRGRAALRCGAGVRSLRAERSHLVVTNHAFVLSRPDYFAHLVFDECDHLHEVTLSVRSFDIELERVTGLARELQQGRGRDRAPLERLQRLLKRLAPGDRSEMLLHQAEQAVHGSRRLDAAAHQCTRELRIYREYRQQEGDQRTPEERAFLLHEYLETGRGDALATALHELRRAVDQVDSALRYCIEELGEVPSRDARRLTWALRRPLDHLGHWREGLELWLGGHSGEADFSDQFHYHVVFEGRRQPMLELKWILPQQWLGEVYLPSVKSAALVSATARLRGGFRSMKGYLGLDLLEQETIDRPGREVREFTGLPTFDPKAALIAVPEDAPPYGWRGPTAETWMEYVEDCLLYLAERTCGRVLGLFTNRLVLQRLGERLAAPFRARGLALYWQGMPGLAKEDLMERFRAEPQSVLLGLDTFWYGVDFPGETCEHVVITKLPYGALDDYTFAQKARMGAGPQRNRVYLPKALAMFRQGCGRLLRSESDRGSILILDRRVLEKRHADFLKELPGGAEEWQEPNIQVADSDTCFERIFSHMKLGAEIERRGLEVPFTAWRAQLAAGD